MKRGHTCRRLRLAALQFVIACALIIFWQAQCCNGVKSIMRVVAGGADHSTSFAESSRPDEPPIYRDYGIIVRKSQQLCGFRIFLVSPAAALVLSGAVPKKRSNQFALIKQDVDPLQITRCNDFTLMFWFSVKLEWIEVIVQAISFQKLCSLVHSVVLCKY